MIITLPFLLMTLHFSQIGLTDALTFIFFTSFYIGACAYLYRYVIRPLVKS